MSNYTDLLSHTLALNSHVLNTKMYVVECVNDVYNQQSLDNSKSTNEPTTPAFTIMTSH